MNPFLDQYKKIIPVVLIIFGLFLFAKTVNEFKTYNTIGTDTPAVNTISVAGKGELFAVPDIATFNYSVTEEAKTVGEAQKKSTEKSNKAIAYLKQNGIEEKDIKTIGYNSYPKYEYETKPQAMYPCSQYGCPPYEGKQVIVGYEVSQTVEVKVRDTSKAGDILSGIGSLEVQNVSGLNFEVDKVDELTRDARKQAINDAKEQARKLASDLGVKLGRVVSFNESGNYPIYYSKAVMADGRGGAEASMPPSPEIPAGEQKITSNVSITYEIK